MKSSPLLFPLFAAFVLAVAARAADPKPNQLSANEKAAGWRLLFNGTSLDGWRGFKQSGPPASGWEIKDGVLTCVKGGKGARIWITDDCSSLRLALATSARVTMMKNARKKDAPPVRA